MIAGFEPTEHAFTAAQELIEKAISEVACPAEAVCDLIVADEARFGEAIHILAPGIPFTDNEDYKAVARTVTLDRLSKPTKSGIVLRDFVFAGAIQSLGKELAERSAEEQRLIYTVWHEVAHALDAVKRSETPSRVLFLQDSNGHFKIRHIASFFQDVVLSEIFACRFSALACNQELADLELASDNAIIGRHLSQLQNETASYGGDPDHLLKIAYAAAQTFWLPFVQYGRVIAHMIGNPQLTRTLSLWPDAPEGMNAVFSGYIELLNSVFACYPRIPADFETHLFSFWVQTALLHGIRFSENPNSGDGIFWDKTLLGSL
jgi:hypothetical protein